MFIQRAIQSNMQKTLAQGKSILLLGPRQTGKTTLLKQLAFDLYITLADPTLRLLYERSLDSLKHQIISLQTSLKRPPLIIIDEVQKIPNIMDLVQYLIDEKIAQFILTGSSARKLKQSGHVNLLPGRVVLFYLDPFSLSELNLNTLTLDELLISGALPELYLTTDPLLKEQLLQSYVSTYLEEEIRRESLVRNLASFSQFLTLSAIEAGNLLNLSKISQELGVAQNTIANYYQILEDCLIADRIEAFTSQSRHKLQKSPKYLFFDLGVLRVCAGASRTPSRDTQGRLFEQFIGLELIRYKHQHPGMFQLKYWRTYNGQEVDWLIETPEQLIPIEVKLKDNPTLKDAKHLIAFMDLYPAAKQAYIIATSLFPYALSDRIKVLPWQHLMGVFAD